MRRVLSFISILFTACVALQKGHNHLPLQGMRYNIYDISGDSANVFEDALRKKLQMAGAVEASSPDSTTESILVALVKRKLGNGGMALQVIAGVVKNSHFTSSTRDLITVSNEEAFSGVAERVAGQVVEDLSENYRPFFIKSSYALFPAKPICLETSSPFLKRIVVGMESIPYFPEYI